MKNRFSVNRILMCLALVVSLFATSCSTGPNPTDVIPSTAAFVASVDITSLARKGELQDLKSMNCYKMIESGVEQQPEEVREFLNLILKDPTVTGISFKDNIYGYMVNKDVDAQYFNVAMVLGDAEKFTQFMSKTIEMEGATFQMETEGGFKRIKLRHNGVLIWDNQYLVLSIASNYPSRKGLLESATALFSLQQTERITALESYNTLSGDDKDMNYWMSADLLIDYVASNNRMMSPMMEPFKGCAGMVHVDFKDGEIVSDSKVYLTEAVKEKYVSSKKMKFNTELYDYFPKNNVAIIASAIDKDMIKKRLEEEKDVDQMDKMFQKQAGVDIQTALATLGNSMMISFSDLQITEGRYGRSNYIPELNLAVALNKDQENKWILDLLAKATRYDQDGYFVLKVTNDINAYFAITDELFYVTNNQKNVRTTVGLSTPEETFASSEIASRFEDTMAFIYLDLEYDHLPKSIKKMALEAFTTSQMSFVDGEYALLEDMQMRSTSPTTGSYTIHFKNKEENSFKQIINLVDNNFVNFMR
ncbi:DUF4836 family protein [Halosquirtibacter xylanolyticus]|uniref:DUF4836 family protein n=1 Tax=Halosquirtibacter xylanolyticus TaxID=3374599 RepID=UPI00374A10B1|nr:DUF4836 family protein [Prolixibacteraceae bacterium]